MRILVTTDGSEHSLNALPHAARLADATGGKLLLTRILDRRMDLAKELTPTLREAAKIVAERWLDELKVTPAVLNAGAAVSVTEMERREDMPTAVLRASKESRANLLVLSTRGAGAVRHALLGSVSMEVLGRSEVPVMLAGTNIQPPADDGPYHLLVTTDGSDAAEAVWEAVDDVFRKVSGASVRITILQVYEPKSADQDDDLAAVDSEWQLSQFRKLAPARFELATVARRLGANEKVADAILTAAGELRADSIWMATQGHSVRKHVLLGSTALGVLKHATLPVALVPVPVSKTKKKK